MKTLVLMASLTFVSSLYATEEVKLGDERGEWSRVPIQRAYTQDEFWDTFVVSVHDYKAVIFEDRLHSLKDLSRLLRYDNDFEGLRDARDNAALGGLSRTISYSAREAFLVSPLGLWLEDRKDVLAQFLKNSIDSGPEQEVTSADPSFQTVQWRWWKGISEHRYRYGIQPFRTNPYLFWGADVQSGGDVLFRLHTRYYFLGSREGRAEFVLSAPLADVATFEIGTSYSREKKDPVGFTARIARKNGRLVTAFIGLNVRERTEFQAGFQVPW